MAGTTALGAGVPVSPGQQDAMIIAAAGFGRIATPPQAPRDWAQQPGTGLTARKVPY
jgi:hypothetical protein